jgi:tripartite-type tricarboxylate transporter receptor subunit TctC
MRPSRLMSIIAMAIVACIGTAANAQEFPERPIQLVVPFPAGGANDVLARVVAEKMGEILKGTVIVDNRPGGAGGSVGAQAVAKAKPDGYTLLLGNTATLAINKSIYPKLSYDAQRDFAPISLLGSSSLVLVTAQSSPAKNMQDLVKMLKAEPGKHSYASAGAGTPLHLAGELFRLQTGTEIAHVPYRGAAPAMTDLIGGRITIMFDNTTTSIPHIKAGTLRPIAVTGPKRNPQLPDVPTMAEAGIANSEVLVWFGLVAPKGTPQPILDKLSQAAMDAVKSDALRKRLVDFDIQPWGSSAEEMRDYTAKETARWHNVVQKANIKLE